MSTTFHSMTLGGAIRAAAGRDYGGDASVRYAIATVVAITAPLSAIMLWRACRTSAEGPMAPPQ